MLTTWSGPQNGEVLAIDYEKLGQRIKHFREQKGISQDELGNLVWVNNVHISNIETGKKAPSIDLLIELANALEISTDDLLVDSLTHSVSTADSEIHKLLVDCNKTEEEILTEMVKALKAILYRSGI